MSYEQTHTITVNVPSANVTVDRNAYWISLTASARTKDEVDETFLAVYRKLKDDLVAAGVDVP